MANPVFVEVTRGRIVESVHRGAVAVSDASGKIVASLGDVETPIFPRSALKPIQALPLLESGAAEAFSLSDEEVALACASHSGEAMHTTRIAAWLARIGCHVDDLACGAHEVREPETVAAMRARNEKPTSLHNNCSGKHTGFLTLACHLGAPITGYVAIDHPVQRAVAQTLKDMGELSAEPQWGVDGCSAPNFTVALGALASAMARFADPSKLPPARTSAAQRIMRAMIAHPELVAGTGRACTALMRQAMGKLVVKTGAEGVFVAVLPDRGLGVALKIDDGATRASETAIAAVLAALGVLDDTGAAHALIHAPVRNTRNAIVGERRPSETLTQFTV